MSGPPTAAAAAAATTVAVNAVKASADAIISMKTIYNRASAAATVSGDSGVLTSTAERVAVDINITAAAGTMPSVQFILERRGADGIFYPAHTFAAASAAGQLSASVGPGCPGNAMLTGTLRLRWVITGTTPSFTFSASIVGR